MQSRNLLTKSRRTGGRSIRGVMSASLIEKTDDFDFSERLGALNEELEVLTGEARQLEEQIAENVAAILSG